MSQGFRPHRVGDQLRADLADLLAREVRDPGLGFLTVTRVEVTSDLQLARVFYTTLGDAARRRETRRALGRVTPFLRREIGRRLRLRRVPVLEFRFDESIEHQDRVERLINELQEQRAAEGGGAESPEHPDHDDDRERG
jgi:ribosome-binding factor A